MRDWFRWVESTGDEIGTMHVAIGANSEHYMPDVQEFDEVSPIEARINDAVEDPPACLCPTSGWA